jgi:hypothetical protein
MTMLKSLVFSVLAAVLLAGCETPVEGRQFPEIGFSHQTPIALNVASVTVEKPAPSAVKGSVEHELPVTLVAVAERWARQRIKPVGQQGTAVVKIEQAQMVEERLKKKGGIKGAFTTDQTERYRATLQMSVSVVDQTGQAQARASGNRTRTVAEDASLADREKIWFQMVESLSRSVDKVLEEQIRKHMTAYLR